MTRLRTSFVCRPVLLSAFGLLVFAIESRAGAADLADGDPKTTLTLKTYATGLDQATDIAPLADGRAVVTQRNGDVVVLKKEGGKALAGHVSVKISLPEMGLLGIVADPDFATNHYLYVYASTSGDDDANRNKVLRLVLGDDDKLS